MKANISTLYRSVLPLLFGFFIFSCKDENKPSEKDIVKEPAKLKDRISENIRLTIDYAAAHKGRITDSSFVFSSPLLRQLYSGRGFTAVWSADGKWAPVGDSLFTFIENSKEYGLFPTDYNYDMLSSIRNTLHTDSLSRKDAALWSRADIVLTDALLQMGRDLKRGRLPYDSLTIRKDTLIINDSFYLNVFAQVDKTKQVSTVLSDLEPKLPGYTALRQGVKSYLDTAKFRPYTYLYYPYSDSVKFFASLATRLVEENIMDSVPPVLDTVMMQKAIKKYQRRKKIKQTGRVDDMMISVLNNTDWEKFKRVALSLDKYKLMRDTMPSEYIWVNIPSYELKLMCDDSLVLESKVIVGAPQTRTPALYSEISNFITYPQWTVPYSIVFKEMLPQIQKDTNYLIKQNLMVVDRNDSVISPSLINWSKLNEKKFPYLIRQRQGDDNSLGVLKFNFRNKYAVYLHDTNARWMFSKKQRALSHGCIRVQNWEDLAYYLVRNDSVKYSPDTLTSWIVRQEKHVVSGFKKVPLYIRYFTCGGEKGRIRFYDDVYAEDKLLTEKYFSKFIN